MTQFRSLLLRTLSERGFLHQGTDLEGLDALATEGPITAYIGFDCTADSLHIGSLIQIMILRRLQQAGHRPIVLMGGGTTRIGDPSGKDEARQLLTDEVIRHNMAGIQRQFANYLTFGSGPTDAVVANNADWLDGIQYIPFLRDYGRHFSVNRMLSFDSVRLRMEREQPLSFLEFNYMILQAYDFVELHRRMGCRLQFGGSDQWGNIVNGIELGRRVDGTSLFGLTSPLITTASGAKMGKTASGAIWLSADRLSPYDFWQFWRNTEDADVGRFLRLFTDLPLDEIARLEALQGNEINEAKKRLAFEVTALCHGSAAAAEAAETARQVFEEGATGAALPTIEIPATALEQGIGVVELLVRSGLAASNGEARRLIKGNGARLNDRPIDDEQRLVKTDDLGSDGFVKLSAGKKRHALVHPA
ncbi:MAG TPA: tyrosine--tRNA ligase [Stellaceae bacterium]|nr:tyrosine--tRNA ligase [Stellaceae bacterium]